MANALDFFESALRELGWRYQADAERATIQLGVNSANGHVDVVIRVDAAEQLATCLAIYPVRVQPADRAAAAEYLHRVNHGLEIGHFELNYTDGEVRFRTVLLSRAPALDVAGARWLVQQTVSTADRYVNGLLEVVYGNVSPAEALREAESPPESEPVASA